MQYMTLSLLPLCHALAHYLQVCSIHTPLWFSVIINLVVFYSSVFTVIFYHKEWWWYVVVFFYCCSFSTSFRHFMMGFGKLGMGIFYIKIACEGKVILNQFIPSYFTLFSIFVFVVENLEPASCDCLAGRTGNPNFSKFFISLEALCTP